MGRFRGCWRDGTDSSRSSPRWTRSWPTCGPRRRDAGRAGILVEDRRCGRALDGLEILVSFRSDEGRVLSVKTRRMGEAEWIRRFEAATRGPGH